MSLNKLRENSSPIHFIARALLILLVLALGIAPKSYAEKLTLTTVDWQPYYGHDLPEKGFVAALTRATFKRAGYDIHIEFQPWKRALETARKGLFDGILGAYYSETRAEYFDFTDAVYENRDIFVCNNKALVNYQQVDELKQYRIASWRGATYTDELKSSGFNVVESNDDLHSLRMLLKNRVDLVLMSRAHFLFLIENEIEFYAQKNRLIPLEKPYRTNLLYVPIVKKREDSELVVKRFNHALSDIKKDGTYQKILQRFGL